ncbi:hypothetical protein BvCmsOUP062_03067 [Escherichia coli]|nr:hypothetical protein BvCmsOUP062_03067 [Escherichia coli]
MNQAIQFPDREEWDENKKCVCFPALVNGMQLTCAISGVSFYWRYARTVVSEFSSASLGSGRRSGKLNSGTK